METPDRSQIQPGTEIGGYRVEGVLGRGGMGVVYRATQLALDRQVALKVIAPELAEDEEFRERFKRESRLAASIEHQHVIPVHEAHETGGLLFITMRLVEGTDLQAMIARGGAIEPRRAARIVAQVGSALDAAHALGLVHRDVKPANVVIGQQDGQDHAFLTDFGLTKSISSESGMTATGMMVGTLDYIAPEQIEGAQLDARADVYALGGVLFHALTGSVPFPKESQPAKIWAHMSAEPPSVRDVRPDLSPELDGVVRRAMAKKPDDRYLSAGDLGRAALAAAEGQQVSRAERSVARGDAAPPGAAAVPARAESTEPGSADPTRARPLPTEPGSADPTRARPLPTRAEPPPTRAEPSPTRAESSPTRATLTPNAATPGGGGAGGGRQESAGASAAQTGSRSKRPLAAVIAGVAGLAALVAVLAIAGVFGGGAEGGGSPSSAEGGQVSDEALIRQTLETWFAAGDPAEKCRLITPDFRRRQESSTGEPCETYLEGRAGAGVDVREIQVQGDTATATAVDSSTEHEVRLERAGPIWQIDEFVGG